MAALSSHNFLDYAALRHLRRQNFPHLCHGCATCISLCIRVCICIWVCSWHCIWLIISMCLCFCFHFSTISKSIQCLLSAFFVLSLCLSLSFPPSSANVYIIILFSMIDFAVDVTGVADRRRGTYNLVGTNIFFDAIRYFCWQQHIVQKYILVGSNIYNDTMIYFGGHQHILWYSTVLLLAATYTMILW